MDRQAQLAELERFALDRVPGPALLERAVATLARGLNLELGVLLELREGQLAPLAGHGFRPGWLERSWLGDGPGSFSEFVSAASGPLVIEKVEGERRFTLPAPLLEHGAKGCVFQRVPLGRERRGVLGAASHHPRTFSEPDLFFLHSVAFILESTLHHAEVEAALRQSEAKYRVLLEQSADAVFIADAQGRYVDVSDLACTMLRRTRDEILRMTIPELVVIEPQEPALRMNLLTENETATTVRTLRRGDGTTFRAEVNARQLPDGRAIGIVRDVTQREADATALRQLSERLSQALRASKAGAWEWEVIADRMFWSDEIYPLMGLEPGSIVPSVQSWVDRVHPDDRPSVAAQVMETIQRRQNLDFEFRLVRPNGEVRWIRAVGNISFDSHGDPLRIFGLQMDVTAQKESERARLEAEDRAHSAQRLEALGRLAGGVAHDFNNLLTGILAAAGLALQESDHPGQARQDLQTIIDAAKRASGLTRQLLAFGRQRPHHPEAVDLLAHLTELEPMLQRLVGEEITLELHHEAHLPAAFIDPGRLDQMILNLVLNARDASPRGGRVMVRTARTASDPSLPGPDGAPAGERFVSVQVQDNGVGMDRETLSRAFEPFFTTKESSRGTGLGLATVHGLAEASGGAVRARSEPGRGSTFELLLPVAGGAVPMKKVEAPREREAGQGTVLVVEDNALIRRLAERILGGAGYAVLSAASGTEALARLTEHARPVELLLCDVVMPGLSGPEVAEQVLARYPEVPVLFMSGYADDVLHRHGVALENAPLLNKPFTPAELLEAVAARRKAG
ncbi:MAG: PAS domain S-box protein [Deltaproteobacteria bacterium]|nr:PAS domain S-box protein [Deltaproteobacteria bacterium]